VSSFREERERLLDECLGFAGLHPSTEVGDPSMCEPHPQLPRAVTGLLRALDERFQLAEGNGYLTDPKPRTAQHGNERDRTLVEGQECERPRKEGSSPGVVSANERTLAGRGKALRSPTRELDGLRATEPKIDPVPVRLLEVVAEDLVQLDQ